MNYTPKDIVDFIFDKQYDADFMTSLMMHKGGFSIAEIPDKQIRCVKNAWFIKSDMFGINVQIEDDEILTALNNKLYITAFISRYKEAYQLHFLVHRYPQDMKERFEEDIAMEVVRYMITKTVVLLRLDTPQKVEGYIKNE